MTKATVLYKLLRLKPVFAWSICGTLLGIAIAINEYGFGLNWSYLIMAVFPIIIIQGLIAHAVNDLEDEVVDRKIDIKGTNRYKVLISGIISREELIIMTCILITITTLSAIYLIIALGFPIIIFYAIALYAALGYSIPPLKLGWKPYAEWTIVFPILVTLVIAVNYVATGYFSYLALAIGVLFALYNIVWFLVSRMMDYDADKEAGKITTFVKKGVCYNYYKFTDNIHPYTAIVILVLFLYIVFFGILINEYIGLASSFMWSSIYYYLPKHNIHGALSPVNLSIVRTKLIFISIINSIIVSLILIFIR